MRSARGESASAPLPSGVAFKLVEPRRCPGGVARLLRVLSGPARCQAAVAVVVLRVVFATSAVWPDRADRGVVESTAHSKVMPRGPDDGNPTVNRSNGPLILLPLPSPRPPLLRDGRSIGGVSRPSATSALEVVLVADDGRPTCLLSDDIPSRVVFQAGGILRARGSQSARLRALVAGANTATAALRRWLRVDYTRQLETRDGTPLTMFLKLSVSSFAVATYWVGRFSFNADSSKELLQPRGKTHAAQSSLGSSVSRTSRMLQTLSVLDPQDMPCPRLKTAIQAS